MKFQLFKKRLKSLLNSISTQYQPMSEDKTFKSSYNSMFRFPTLALEPYFCERFGNISPDKLVEPEAEHITQLRESALESFKKETPVNLNQILFAKARDITCELLGLTNVRFTPYNLLHCVNEAAKPTSSGFPDFGKKNELTLHDLDQARYAMAMSDFSFFNYPVTVAWRTQQRSSGTKYRLIYLIPYLVTIFEFMFFLPFRKFYSENKVSTPYCFGNTWLDLRQRYDSLQGYKYIYSLDYKGWDLSIPGFLIYLFFSLIKPCFNWNSKLTNIFDHIVKYHLSATILLSGTEKTAQFVQKKNGIMSGSVFTSFMCSLINVFVITYFLLSKNLPINYNMIHVMGDDCLFGCDSELDLEEINEFMQQNFGISVSVEKSTAHVRGEPIFFLGAYLDDKGRYIDEELVKDQLRITQSWDSEMPEFDRVFSKLCSACFKFSDGKHLFFREVPFLLAHYGVRSIPEFYYNLDVPLGGPDVNLPIKRVLSVLNMAEYGWMYQ